MWIQDSKVTRLWGGDAAQLVRASDRHVANAGSIPRCGKGLLSQCQLSVQTLLRCPHTPYAIACINICAHVKDPVVHVRFRWIMETLKHQACTVGWVARSCRSWLSPGKATRISRGKIQLGQYSCKKKKCAGGIAKSQQCGVRIAESQEHNVERG